MTQKEKYELLMKDTNLATTVSKLSTLLFAIEADDILRAQLKRVIKLLLEN